MTLPFRKHVQVMLKPGLAPETLKALAPQFVPHTLYMVFAVVENDDEGGDTLWLGPAESDWNLVDSFDPAQLHDRQLKDVYPIAAIHVTRLDDYAVGLH